MRRAAFCRAPAHGGYLHGRCGRRIPVERDNVVNPPQYCSKTCNNRANYWRNRTAPRIRPLTMCRAPLAHNPSAPCAQLHRNPRWCSLACRVRAWYWRHRLRSAA